MPGISDGWMSHGRILGTSCHLVSVQFTSSAISMKSTTIFSLHTTMALSSAFMARNPGCDSCMAEGTPCKQYLAGRACTGSMKDFFSKKNVEKFVKKSFMLPVMASRNAQYTDDGHGSAGPRLVLCASSGAAMLQNTQILQMNMEHHAILQVTWSCWENGRTIGIPAGERRESSMPKKAAVGSRGQEGGEGSGKHEGDLQEHPQTILTHFTLQQAALSLSASRPTASIQPNNLTCLNRITADSELNVTADIVPNNFQPVMVRKSSDSHIGVEHTECIAQSVTPNQNLQIIVTQPKDMQAASREQANRHSHAACKAQQQDFADSQSATADQIQEGPWWLARWTASITSTESDGAEKFYSVHRGWRTGVFTSRLAAFLLASGVKGGNWKSSQSK
ncbi:uncharacterized protein F5147DRAFT_650962 [Suillus discolor]|uniref:Uncharacterized protein n=1 Tax=Suillus discolor TaxID=1912936 RepID=A0A9P7JWS9_9AGAM|nr:uncharacterized protein F5147DRAFT_650962 [Suillus discolor]KAG2112327.1 hypothetical protein F5147DRAFT_650962 [Suillus discolor]